MTGELALTDSLSFAEEKIGRQLRLCKQTLEELAIFYRFKLASPQQSGFGPAQLYIQLEIERLFLGLQTDIVGLAVRTL